MHTALYDDLLITKTPPFRNVPERRFLAIIKGYSHITVLTPEIMHEIIDSIVIHAPDKSIGHRKQMVDINFRFNVLKVSAVLDRRNYDIRTTLRKRLHEALDR